LHDLVGRVFWLSSGDRAGLRQRTVWYWPWGSGTAVSMSPAQRCITASSLASCSCSRPALRRRTNETTSANCVRRLSFESTKCAVSSTRPSTWLR